jgi:hypothetical protein
MLGHGTGVDGLCSGDVEHHGCHGLDGEGENPKGLFAEWRNGLDLGLIGAAFASLR